jgi:hypothetical protein
LAVDIVTLAGTFAAMSAHISRIQFQGARIYSVSQRRPEQVGLRLASQALRRMADSRMPSANSGVTEGLPSPS